MPSEPFVGEIMMWGGTFAPYGWAFCNGQLMNIAEYDALYSLIGTTYGGDGQTTFALPNLQSRVPIDAGTGSGLSPYTPGQTGGAENVTLTTAQLPSHNHSLQAQSGNGNVADPTNALWAASALNQYSPNPANAAMNAASGPQPSGGNQPHPNIMPVLAVSFVIALQGIFPARN